MSQFPLISVIMPAYNAEKFIGKAIDSILNQTLSDFELIVIDDGSTDKTLQIIKSYTEKDNRMVVISRKNKGLVVSLNESILIARGEYIARMDADDISLPERFEQQVKFLRNNNLDICGSAIRQFSNEKDLGLKHYPSNDYDIKFLLLFINSFAHPAVMIKSCVFKKVSYRSGKHKNLDNYSEDYQLWVDMALENFKMGNINQVLLKYRVHNNQISVVHDAKQVTADIGFSYLSQLEGGKEIARYFSLFLNDSNISIWNQLCGHLMVYKKQHKVNDMYFVEVLRHILRDATKNNFIYFLVYRKWTQHMKKDFTGEVYMLVQCLLFLHKKSKLYQLLKKIYLKL